MIVLEANAPLKEKLTVSYVRSPINYRKYFQQRKRFLLWKRAVDIIFSSLIIVLVLSWLLPIIAELIKISSKAH